MAQNALISAISDWLVDQALGTPDMVEMFDHVCNSLHASGVPITRARLIWPTLHPLFQAETIIWRRDEAAKLEQYEHSAGESDDEAWRASPLSYVVENSVPLFRRELTGPNQSLDFKLLEELKSDGITDYMILNTDFDRAKQGRKNNGIIVTWASSRSSRFSNDDLLALQEIQKVFAVACKTAIQNRISHTVTTTYLGDRAGENVLNGQIRRGDGEEIDAIVMFSDMRDSTMFAETMPAEDYFSMLNQYFEATAGSVIQEGGEVLDFIGDGVLAIFPYECSKSLKEAGHKANQAIATALSEVARVNIDREKSGVQKFGFGIGADVGKVMFGNIGIPQRLSFSVIGPTVNQVARIEQMTKLLQQPVLAGPNLAKVHPKVWKSVGEHKLDGVLNEQELFAYQVAA